MNVYIYDAGNFTPIPVLSTTEDIGIQEYVYYSGGQYNYSFSIITSDRPLQFIEKDTSAARTVIVRHPTSVGLTFFTAQSTGGDTFTNINVATVTSTTEGTDTIYTITVPANYRLAITFTYSSSSGGGAQPWYRYNCYGIVPDAIGTGILPKWVSANIYEMMPGQPTYTWVDVTGGNKTGVYINASGTITATSQTNRAVKRWSVTAGDRVRVKFTGTGTAGVYNGSVATAQWWFIPANTPNAGATFYLPVDLITIGTNEYEFTVPTGATYIVFGYTGGNIATQLTYATVKKGTDPVPGISSWQTATLHESTNNIWS